MPGINSSTVTDVLLCKAAPHLFMTCVAFPLLCKSGLCEIPCSATLLTHPGFFSFTLWALGLRAYGWVAAIVSHEVVYLGALKTWIYQRFKQLTFMKGLKCL